MNLAFLNGLKQAATSKAGIAALTLSKNSPPSSSESVSWASWGPSSSPAAAP